MQEICCLLWCLVYSVETLAVAPPCVEVGVILFIVRQQGQE